MASVNPLTIPEHARLSLSQFPLCGYLETLKEMAFLCKEEMLFNSSVLLIIGQSQYINIIKIRELCNVV